VLSAEGTQATPAARAHLFRDARVLEIMEPWPPTIAPEAEVGRAAREMLRHETQRLFVERGGALVGVLSQSDIVAALAAGRLAPVQAVAGLA
jgi:CBS domain-containing protein